MKQPYFTRLMMHRAKSKGPKMDPYGIPIDTEPQSERWSYNKSYLAPWNP